MRVLMVALNKAFVDSLAALNKNYEVYILEEKELYDSNPKAYNSEIIKDVRFGEYQQSEAFINTICEWNAKIGFDVIVPGMEYAVKGTYQAIEKLGFFSPGAKAVEAFTNKYKLRLACSEIGVPQPNYSKVNCAAQVEAFYHDKPIIIKPTNRRASVGVVKAEKKEDIIHAWEECINASEGNRVVKRNLQWEYIAEDFLDGPEVSVESLVFEGQFIFHNVTYKDTIGGNYFAETGHIVPAPLSDEEKQSLVYAKELMLSGLGVRCGLFHSEWKITSEGPRLVECAARAPGDKIPELINEVYQFNLYEAFLYVLMGKRPEVKYSCNGFAGIRYFKPNPGKLIKIEGTDILENNMNVLKYQLNASPGQIIKPIKCSWDRVGYFMAKGSSLNELKQKLDEIENKIRFSVE